MRPFHDNHRIAQIAARQHGNVTLAQLRECGLSSQSVKRRAGSGWLIPRHRGVFAVGHVPRSRESTWWAAVLALGAEAVLSHMAAAALWDLVPGAVATHVTVPDGAGLANRDGIVVHRQAMPPEHRSTRRGLPCTNLVRTVLDVAAISSLRRTATVFEEAQVKAQLRPEVLAAEVLCRPGHRGTGRLRIILDGAVEPAGVRSILELRFLRLCTAHGIPRPLVNERIGKWIPDFLWPEHMLVVETDGADFHRTPAKRRRDSEKDSFLRSLGFTVIRLTWADVVGRPDATAASILARLSVV